MSTHNIPFFNMKKKHPKLSQICSYGIFSKGFKKEFERAVVNEPSVFEPLKFYCKNVYKICYLSSPLVQRHYIFSSNYPITETTFT